MPTSPTIFSTAATHEFTVPANVTSLKIHIWMGGAGGHSGGEEATGDGGGGGGYARKEALSVTPGQEFSFDLFAPATHGEEGTIPNVYDSTHSILLSGNGTGGSPPASRSAGDYSGDTFWDVTIPGGVGGEAGVTSGAGGDGAGDGGLGGASVAAGEAGLPGTSPGGGGGGGGGFEAFEGGGGDGGLGMIIITWVEDEEGEGGGEGGSESENPGGGFNACMMLLLGRNS